MTRYEGGMETSRELPPLPPLGAFDVGFACISSVEGDGAGLHLIMFFGAAFPITVTLKGLGKRVGTLQNPLDEAVLS